MTDIGEPQQEPEKSKKISQVASAVPRTQSSNNEKRKIIKIKPEFDNSRLWQNSHHSNNKPSKGFIKDNQVSIINKAIGLDNMDNLNETSFYMSKNNFLLIACKLKRNMSIQEIYESIHQFFWFDKTS